MRDNKFLLFKLLSLWHFVPAALEKLVQSHSFPSCSLMVYSSQRNHSDQINCILSLPYAKHTVAPDRLRIKCKFLIWAYEAPHALTPASLTDLILYLLSFAPFPLQPVLTLLFLGKVKNASTSWLLHSLFLLSVNLFLKICALFVSQFIQNSWKGPLVRTF